jgi:hypothetical protein
MITLTSIIEKQQTQQELNEKERRVSLMPLYKVLGYDSPEACVKWAVDNARKVKNLLI